MTEKWQVRPDQIGDLLAIMGDSVDNIRGVKGIGAKGAVALLHRFETLDSIYQHLDEVERPRTRQLLTDGRESARLARELVELVCDVPMDVGLDDLEPSQPDQEALTESFRELGFRRLMRTFYSPEAEAPARVEVEVVEESGLAALDRTLRTASEVAVDVILSGNDVARRSPMEGALLGLALAVSSERAYFVPARMDLEGPVHPTLRRILEDPAVAKVGHDLKYTLVALRRHGVQLDGLRFDAQLASYLVASNMRNHDLSSVALARAGYKMTEYVELFGKGRDQLRHEAGTQAARATFCGERVAMACSVIERLRPLLDEHGVAVLHLELELPLTRVLADMEMCGIGLDVAELERQSAAIGEQLETIEATIHGHAGEPFNINSPKQLGVVLFETLGLPAKKKTKTGYSTNQAVLDTLMDAHPIVPLLLTWRQLSKLKNTYTDALPLLVHGRTGRIHTSFNQAVAATGRLSSTDPNLQNIPIRTAEGRKVRRAFVADPGHVLMSADYSQVELRVMAHLASEEAMVAAFRADLDIHRQTAAEIFHVSAEEVTVEQRAAAKTINFGILYGMGSTRLSAAIGVTRKEAKAFISNYFERFPGVRGFVDQTLDSARESLEVRTLFGRRRPVPEIDGSNPMLRAAAERIAVNSPVQGTAADLMKRAMLLVDERLKRSTSSAKILLQVHDELLLEVPEAEIEEVAELLRQGMADAGTLQVPLKVDVGWGATWAEAH